MSVISSTSRTELSPSLLKSWSRCRKQYYFKAVCGLRWPSENPFVLGTTVHKLMDYQSRRFTELPIFKKILAAASPDIQAHWHLLETDPISQWEVIANEWGFQVPVTATHWLAGRIDRIARDPQGKIWVLDWKTGTGVPQNMEDDWQTLVYCYATFLGARDLGLQALCPDSIGFAYVEAKAGSRLSPHQHKIKIYKIDYGQKRHILAQQRFERVVQALVHAKTQEDYPLPEACPDRFCCYRPICGI